ncbi:MAG: hypothetical protein WCF95_03135 [bacterium]
MKVSGINNPARLSFASKNTAAKNPEKKSSCNFCGNDSTTVGAAIISASALIGFLIYLGLAPQGKKAATKEVDSFQLQQKTAPFSQNSEKNLALNRPSNKHYQRLLKKQERLKTA